MKIEKQVCSLEQAKKLKQLGVAQTSIFKWCNEHQHYGDDGAYYTDSTYKVYNRGQFSAGTNNTFSAFSTAELGVMLPSFFPSFVHDELKSCHCRNERVDTFPLIDSGEEHEQTPAHKLNKELIPIQAASTEAEARAEMLIYLIENRYVLVSEVNERIAKA